MKKFLISIFCVLILGQGASFASEREYRSISGDYNAIIFSPFGGYYWFQAHQKFQGTTPNYELADSYSAGLRLGYQINRYFDAEGTINFVPASHNLGDVNVYLYHADLLFNFLDYDRVTPYLDLGFGAATYSPLVGSSDTDPLITYSAGIRVFIIERFAFRFDVRGYTKFDSTSTNLNVTCGLTYYAWFKKIKDSDHDGYTDDYDLCPSAPEDFNGYLDEDGCPEGKTGELPIKEICP